MMLKYKVGDVVTLGKNVYVDRGKLFTPGTKVKIKEICTTSSPSNEHYTVHLLEEETETWWVVDSEIEHSESGLTTFLKTQPWFIRPGTPEKSVVVQKWLFENGVTWFDGTSYTSMTYANFLTNTNRTGYHNGGFEWCNHLNENGAKEITLEFETVVKSFKLPEVKTQQDKLIEELEETIKKAQQQIEGLKSK